jgi:hypothetical protein
MLRTFQRYLNSLKEIYGVEMLTLMVVCIVLAFINLIGVVAGVWNTSSIYWAQ